MEVVTPPGWCEHGVNTETVPDDLFYVRAARVFLSRHIQLFAYDPRPIIDVLRRHKPHVIDMDHEPYSIPCAEIVTLRNIYAPGTPIVMQSAQNILKTYPPPFAYLEKRALRQIAAAYICNQDARKVLQAKGFRKPIRLVPFGVDLDLFPFSERTNREALTIGYVGRLMPAKGLALLADALVRLKDEKWRLVVVGDGVERVSVERKLSEAGLLKRVVFAGAVPYESVPRYFREMDILVVPTITTKKIREQFGRVIVEAMASGVPVIGSSCGAISEVIGDAGIIYPERDPVLLADALNRLLKDPQMRRRLAHDGRRRVEENYSWTTAAVGIFSLYDEVLTGKDIW
jgi:glycosyltransferase involved in cell wall biosynthesis